MTVRTASPKDTIDLRPPVTRTLRISAYVDRALDEVVEIFARPGIDAMLAAAVQTALGSADARATVHAAKPVWVTAGHASVAVTWRVVGRSGRANDGKASIALLMVQSGHDPMTELLVALTVAGDDPVASAKTHGVLDEITRLLSPALTAP